MQLMLKPIFTVLLLLFSYIGQAQILPFALDQDRSEISLGEIGDFFKDESGELALQDVMQPNYNNQFLPIQSEFIQLGSVSGYVWIKATINVTNVNDLSLALQVRAPRLLILDVYLPQIYGLETVTESGLLRPLNNKKNQSYTLIPLNDNTPDNIDIYIKMSSVTAINADIRVVPVNELTKSYQAEYLISGLLIGIMVFIFLSNIFFFAMSGNSMYLYYSMVLVNAVVLHVILHGYLAHLLPSLFPYQAQIYNVSVLLATSATLLFSRAYLEIKNRLSFFDSPLLLLCVINTVFAFSAAFTPDIIPATYVSTLILVSALFLTTVGITASICRVPFAHYYLVARLTLFVGYSYWVLNRHGIASNMTFFFWGLTSSILLEAMIHFFGVFAKSNVFISASLSKKKRFSNNDQSLAIIKDLTGRMKRQLNIVSGYLNGLPDVYAHKEDNDANNIEKANRNLEHIVERLENLTDLQYITNNNSVSYTYIDSLIEETLNLFHELDQDATQVQLVAPDILRDEQVSQARLLKHLLLSLLLEFRNFSHQTLTVTLSKAMNSQEGLSYLDIKITPLPRHIAEDDGTQLNLGIGYIQHLIAQLNGRILQSDQPEQEFRIHLPARYRLVDRKPEIKNIQSCQLFIMNNHTNTGKKLLSLLQTWPISIIQVQDMAELHKHDIQSSRKGIVNIVIFLEHSGYIPQLAVQHIKPLIRIEDQCLLITDNIKMPKDFAFTLGFDQLIYTLELEHKLKSTLVSLTEKGLRLQDARLSSK
ncbi:hypothetical protein CBF23_011040 [Marinomonas agarivorans]|nr:hypothetical protein CBF23_011040 [Marinomonas agarivorans]